MTGEPGIGLGSMIMKPVALVQELSPAIVENFSFSASAEVPFINES